MIKIKKAHFLQAFILLIFLLAACGKKSASNSQGSNAAEDKPLVVTTIGPYKFLLNTLAGDYIQVLNLSEGSGDPHALQLNPQQSIELKKASLFLSLNPNEESLVLKSLGAKTKVAEMWHGFPLLASQEHEHEHDEHDDDHDDDHDVHADDHDEHDDHEADHDEHDDDHDHDKHDDHDHDNDHDAHADDHDDHDEHDAHEADHDEHGEGENWNEHFWLGPVPLQMQIATMAQELSALLPEHTEEIQKNKDMLVERAQDLAEQLKAKLPQLQNGKIFTFHAALGYFAKLFDAEELHIESQGIELGPKEILELSNTVKELSFPVLIYQPQFQKEKAITLGEQLGLDLLEFDPLVPDVFENLEDLAEKLASYQN